MLIFYILVHFHVQLAKEITSEFGTLFYFYSLERFTKFWKVNFL